jgi:hypothetical protein
MPFFFYNNLNCIYYEASHKFVNKNYHLNAAGAGGAYEWIFLVHSLARFLFCYFAEICLIFI